MSKTYYTCKTMNVKAGVTKNGNDYRRFGMKIQSGPKKDQWINYFRVLTEKTASYYKKDAAAMGVTNDDPENFQCDGRLVTVWAEPEEFNGRTSLKAEGIYPYDANKETDTTGPDETSTKLPF